MEIMPIKRRDIVAAFLILGVLALVACVSISINSEKAGIEIEDDPDAPVENGEWTYHGEGPPEDEPDSRNWRYDGEFPD